MRSGSKKSRRTQPPAPPRLLAHNGAYTGVSTQSAGSGGGHSHTASGSTNLPPYYSLYFIMKTA